MFCIAEQLVRVGQNEVNVNCLRDNNGRVVVDNEEIKKILKGYMECLLKKEKGLG